MATAQLVATGACSGSVCPDVRLLQLVTGPDRLLDLHPNVTIVQGIDESEREQLIRTVVGLARGEARGEGLLEAHGVLFGLDQQHLDQLELPRLDVDPIVRLEQLPGQRKPIDLGELQAQQARFAVLLERIAALVEEQSHARDVAAATSAALARAREAQSAAEQAAAVPAVGATRRAEVEERLLELWAEQETAATLRDEREQHVAQLAEAVDVAAARTSALEGVLEALGRRSEVTRGAPLPDMAQAQEPPDEDAATDELGSDDVPAVEQRLREIELLLQVHTDSNLAPLEQSMELLRAGSASVPSAAARTLADEIDALDERLREGGAAGETGSVTAVARARLDDARQALLEAEQAVRRPVLGSNDAEELEQAHDRLLDAVERSESRFGRGRAQRRVEEAREAEQVVLDRFGFRSYADYVMGGSNRAADPALDAALVGARAELQAAEEQWRSLEVQVAEELVRAERLDARRALSERALALLGRAVEPVEEAEELRRLRVPAVEPAAAIASVRSALDALGVDLGDEDLDLEELTVLAEAASEAAREADRRHLELIEERAALQARQIALGSGEPPAAAFGAALQLVREDTAAPEPSDDDRARHVEAEAELTSARELEQAARAALEAARAELEAVVGDLAALAEAIDRTELDLEHADVSTDDAPVEGDGAPSAPVDALAAVEQATHEHQRAVDRLDEVERQLAVLDEEGRSLAAQIERQEELVAAQDDGSSATTDEIEWYLLARVAGQRSAAVVGALPFVLDGTLAQVSTEEAHWLLDRLERMAEAVQVIVLSDDPELAVWVESVGPARAAVVTVTTA